MVIYKVSTTSIRPRSKIEKRKSLLEPSVQNIQSNQNGNRPEDAAADIHLQALHAGQLSFDFYHIGDSITLDMMKSVTDNSVPIDILILSLEHRVAALYHMNAVAHYDAVTLNESRVDAIYPHSLDRNIFSRAAHYENAQKEQRSHRPKNLLHSISLRLFKPGRTSFLPSTVP